MGGKACFQFEPDSDRGNEISEWTCAKCRQNGAQRRFTITMDEEEFYNFRALAIDQGRSMSSTIIRYAQIGIEALAAKREGRR